MRLIDADNFLKEYCSGCDVADQPDFCKHCSIKRHVNEEPTIDAAPIVHAQWIEESGTIVCSHCKHKRNTADREYTFYCGHCGAKMGEDK